MSYVDTLHLGLCVSKFKLTEQEWKQLEDAKLTARESFFSDEWMEFKGKVFQIKGARKIYRYVLVNDDFTVKIARKVSGGAYPEVFLEFRSRLLLAGLEDACVAVLQWVSKWADIQSAKVSRADLTADIAGDMRINMDDVVMRCRRSTEHYDSFEVHRNGRRLTGYTFGSGDLRLRIYDKTFEIEVKGKQYIKDEWKLKGWDGISPVWRVEYQLRRKVLKEFKVETVRDLMRNAPDMWRYLTGEWFTVRKRSNADNTRSRWALSESWEIVHKALLCFGVLSGIVREKIKSVKIDNLMPQLAGLVTSLMALCSIPELDLMELERRVGLHYGKKNELVKDVIRDKFVKYVMFEESSEVLEQGY